MCVCVLIVGSCCNCFNFIVCNVITNIRIKVIFTNYINNTLFTFFLDRTHFNINWVVKSKSNYIISQILSFKIYFGGHLLVLIKRLNHIGVFLIIQMFIGVSA